MQKILVAGVGNIFLGDDGFGSEVAARLAARTLPEGVRVVDYGIRGVHLAYDLLDGVDALVLVDAVPPAGRPPGTLVVLEVGPDDFGDGSYDAHAMAPAAVLGTLGSLGGTLPPTYVVGCVPVSTDEGIGLSAPVADAVTGAVAEVEALVARLATAQEASA